MSAERFVAEIPIRWSPAAERVAHARLRTAQALANESLAHYLRRAHAYQRDPDLRRLRAELDAAGAEGRARQPKRLKKKRPAKPVPVAVNPRRYEFASDAERNAAWNALRERYGLTVAPVAKRSLRAIALNEADNAFARALTARQKQLGVRGLDAATIHHSIVVVQRDRVLRYVGVKRVVRADGTPVKVGHPQFASGRRPVTSASGSSSAKNDGAISVDLAAGTLTWKAARGQHAIVARLRWPKADPWIRKACALPIAQVRVLYRMLRGRRRWYVQLVLVGTPPVAPRHRDSVAARAAGVVGVDVGVRHIAAVGPDSALLADLAPTMIARERARDAGVVDERDGDRRKRDLRVRRLQRAIARSRATTNAGAIRHRSKTLRKTRDGRAVGKVVEVPAGFRRGARLETSARVRVAMAELAEIARADAAARDNDHGRLANVVLAMGDAIALERIGYVAFQRAFGRQVRRHAPGAFEARLRRRAPLFGVDVASLATRELALSQTCHACGAREAVPIRGRIADRHHPECSCGRAAMHRDLYSAFLARHARETSIDRHAAQAAWPRVFVLASSARSTYDTAETGRALRPVRLRDLGLADRDVALQAQVAGDAPAAVADPTTHAPATVRDGAQGRGEMRLERCDDGDVVQDRSTQAQRASPPSPAARTGGRRVRAEPPLDKRRSRSRKD